MTESTRWGTRQRRRLRVHMLAASRDLLWVYGWRDVVAWPITAMEVARFRVGDKVEVRGGH